uniref:Uncharacterized protein LOC112813604 isoform X2 n=1 Tax=Callorhinus ursinus TaxID=34884 RepID=A0A3Q7N6N5_CALUR|nr:uncharacterized protein LOC112813604 isoform X2 [Callorhinus ursinus]
MPGGPREGPLSREKPGSEPVSLTHGWLPASLHPSTPGSTASKRLATVASESTCSGDRTWWSGRASLRNGPSVASDGGTHRWMRGRARDQCSLPVFTAERSLEPLPGQWACSSIPGTTTGPARLCAPGHGVRPSRPSLDSPRVQSCWEVSVCGQEDGFWFDFFQTLVFFDPLTI